MLDSLSRWSSYSSYLIFLSLCQLLERALEACGNDLDSAIKSLNELRLGSADSKPDSMGTNDQLPPQGIHFDICKVFQVCIKMFFWLFSGYIFSEILLV